MKGTTLRRNPGPDWGPAFVLRAEGVLPRAVFRFLLKVGVWGAVAGMPDQRRWSREYLTVVFGRPARLVEVWAHFLALMEALMDLMRAGQGAPVRCAVEPAEAGEFEALARAPGPALFGTFHFGASDLLGYLLADWGRRVSILRLRVDNSPETGALAERFGDKVSFLWVNDPARLIFDLKTAIEAGASLALKCDRMEFSARNEPFRFLGAPRLFPFTIYHLAILFNLPVVFCIAVRGERELALQVRASPVFRPDPLASREENLAAGRRHFQAVLDQLELVLRRYPYLWFNFLPLNPVVEEATTAAATR